MAKKHGIVKRYWGSGVHLSSYDGEAKTSGLQRKALLKFSGKHVEIQASYEQDALVGITQLDNPVAIRSSSGDVVGHATLRQLLYTQYKIGNGIELFWEIHQMGLMADVDVVRPKDDEARFIINQMNKNIAAYLIYDLTSGPKPMATAFVEELVRECTDATLVAEVPLCKWDLEKKELWTPRDEALEADKKQEEAEWYLNIEALDIGGKGKAKKKGGQVDRDKLLRFSDTNSFTTLNVSEGNRAGSKGYGGDEGMPVLSLGKTRAAIKPPGQDGNKEADGDGEDGVSALTGTSGVSSSRKEVQRLQQELTAAKARIASLSEPRSTASREESGSSSEESSSESTETSGTSSSAPTNFGGAAEGPGADPDA